MRKLSFSARAGRCPECLAAIPHMFHEPWCKARKRRWREWTVYFLIACLWIMFMVLWVVEAGRPYP